MNNAEERKSVSFRESRARDVFVVAERGDGKEKIAQGRSHLPRMAAETGRVSTYDPVASRVELATA